MWHAVLELDGERDQHLREQCRQRKLNVYAVLLFYFVCLYLIHVPIMLMIGVLFVVIAAVRHNFRPSMNLYSR